MIRNGSLVSASLDGRVTVSVIALSNILHASCSLPEEYRDHTEGLLGKKQAGPRLRGSGHAETQTPRLQAAPPPVSLCTFHAVSLSQPPWSRTLWAQNGREGQKPLQL